MHVPFRQALLCAGLALAAANAAAAPRLHCHLEQGGEAADIQAAPTTDPYTVASQRVNHFRFKAVVVGAVGRVDYVKLYTYYETTGGGAEAGGADVRLIQEAKYLAPPVQAGAGSSLTGTVYLYEPRLGREFSYDCALREEGA